MPVRFYPSYAYANLENVITKKDGSPLHGEIEVYKKLWDDLGKSSDDWHVWHNLTLPTHSPNYNPRKKSESQIDFLVLSKKGLIVLEVKGGPVSTQDNTFYYNKKGSPPKKMENPFHQAKGYRFTLKDEIFPQLKTCHFCEAVVFPHVKYEFESLIFNQEQLWTHHKRDLFDDSLENFILHVFKTEKEKHKRYRRNFNDLSQKEYKKILSTLNPKINGGLYMTPSSTKAWLGIDNLDILNGLKQNPRIMIEGPPGSGKTTLAKAYIDRQFRKKGLLICWNRFLMIHLKNELRIRDNNEIDVMTYYQFLQMLDSNLKSQDILQSENHEEFTAKVQEIVNKHLLQDEVNILYDYIIIDEGQELFHRGIDIIIDKFCGSNGQGLKNGNSMILYDNNQAYNATSQISLEYAEFIMEYYSHFRLDKIKRSAQNPDISSLAEIFLTKPDVLLDNDILDKMCDIEVTHFESLKDLRKHLSSKLLPRLRDEKESSFIGKNAIFLYDSSLITHEDHRGDNLIDVLDIVNIQELNPDNLTDTSNTLKHTSILKYKGLEKQYVFLAVKKPFDFNQSEIYIGITRCMAQLSIYILNE